ncbi:MAG: hypothetical protein M1831_004605 [Alyxoria varia]|nr:MAG: hypothetical protein M1831_004605 [Alyxoria varia]
MDYTQEKNQFWWVLPEIPKVASDTSSMNESRNRSKEDTFRNEDTDERRSDSSDMGKKHEQKKWSKSMEESIPESPTSDGTTIAEDTAEDTAAAPEVRQVHGVKWFLVVFGILSSCFIFALDNTIVANITPSMVTDLHDVGQLAWLSVGFNLGGVAVVLAFGKLFGLFDAKILYISSTVLFLGASAVCGASPSMAGEIVGRVLAGAGGIGMYLGCLTLLSVNTTEKERPIYLSLIGLIWGIGTVLGPVVGGGFDKIDWRWAFYINLIIGGIFAPVYLFLLPSFDPLPTTPIRTRIASFDFLGSALSSGLFLAIIMAINFGGVLYRWMSGQIMALFVVAGGLCIVFALQQGFGFLTDRSSRVFPMHFLRRKEPVLLFVASAAVNAAGFIPVYYIPIYFQFTKGDDAIQSAVRLLPLIFMLSFFILLNGGLMSKVGYYQPWYVFGSVLLVVGGALLYTIDSNTPTANIYGYEVLIGIGAGCFIQAGYAVIQVTVEAADFAYGMSFMMLAQLGGISLGVAIASAVFINSASNHLKELLPLASESQIQQAISGLSGDFFKSLDPELKKQALDILVGDLRKV